MWPTWSHPSIEYGAEDGKNMAIVSLQSSTDSPTKHELELFKYVLNKSELNLKRDHAFPAVCQAACRWKRLDMWIKAIQICSEERCIGHLAVEDWIAFIAAFGANEVLPM
jgi:hypothetical protein